MISKPFVLSLALVSASFTPALHAQNVGTAGSGTTAAGGSIRPSTAPAGPSAGDTGITVNTPPVTQSAAGANVGALAPPGTPDMSPTMPSRSMIDRAGQTDAASPAGGANLPRGVSVTPRAAGTAPMSGIPMSQIPTISRGTEPIGPQAAGAAERRPNATEQPVAGAPQPDANTQIGMGRTTVVPTPPPSAHVEVPSATATDAANQVWVPGHYSWLGGEWMWLEGGWQRPPSPNAVWVVGTYDAQNHRWTEGHWETTATAAARDRNTTDRTAAPGR